MNYIDQNYLKKIKLSAKIKYENGNYFLDLSIKCKDNQISSAINGKNIIFTITKESYTKSDAACESIESVSFKIQFMYSESTADTSLMGFSMTKKEEEKEENFESYYFCDFVNHPIILTELVGYTIDAYVDTTSKHTEEISLDHRYPMFYIGSTGVSIENILLASSVNPDRNIWVIITLELNIYYHSIILL